MIIDRVSLYNRWVIGIIFLLPMFLMAMSTVAEDVNSLVFYEDGPIEYTQFVVYLTASIVAAIIGIAFHFKKHRSFSFIYYLAAAGIFIVAMEEISWGQRIFEIESPEYFKLHSVVNEINIHNLDYMSISNIWARCLVLSVVFYLSFAWLLAPRTLTKHSLAHYLVPSWFLSSYFVFPVLWGLGWWYLAGDSPNFPYLRPHSLAESVEFVWALGCLLFMILGILRLPSVKAK